MRGRFSIIIDEHHCCRTADVDVPMTYICARKIIDIVNHVAEPMLVNVHNVHVRMCTCTYDHEH